MFKAYFMNKVTGGSSVIGSGETAEAAEKAALAKPRIRWELCDRIDIRDEHGNSVKYVQPPKGKMGGETDQLKRLNAAVEKRLDSGDVQYRGYTIRHNPMSGDWFIIKDGVTVARPKDLADAKKQIDGLVTGMKHMQAGEGDSAKKVAALKAMDEAGHLARDFLKTVRGEGAEVLSHLGLARQYLARL
jgi:hypothetical protein